jgi:[ribosomal protein S5]-alanine N-acetyltransferase
MPHFVESPRIALRPLAQRDRELYVRLYTSPEVMRHVGVPMETGAAGRSFERCLAEPAPCDGWPTRWVVHAHERGRDIGVFGLFRCASDAAAEFGIMLLPDAAGDGLAGDAIMAMVAHVFAARWVEVMRARHAEDNVTVSRMLARLGFARAGADAEGRWEWEMTASDWRRKTGAAAMAKVDATG